MRTGEHYAAMYFDTRLASGVPEMVPSQQPTSCCTGPMRRDELSRNEPCVSCTAGVQVANSLLAHTAHTCLHSIPVAPHSSEPLLYGSHPATDTPQHALAAH